MYVDTSSLFAFYINESRSSEVQQILSSSEQIILSSLTRIEFLSSLKKRHRINEITSTTVEKIYAMFLEHIKGSVFELLVPTEKTFQVAEKVLKETQTSLRTLDALHLAIAFENKTSLYTYDLVLLNAAKELNIGIIEPHSG